MPQPHNSSRLLAAVSGTEWLFLEFNELEVLAFEDLAEADVWQSPGLYCANNATFVIMSMLCPDLLTRQVPKESQIYSTFKSQIG